MGAFKLFDMSGSNRRDNILELSQTDFVVREELENHIQELSGKIGERNLSKYQNLVKASNYIEESFTKSGYQVKRQSFKVGDLSCDNIEVEIIGKIRPDEIVIVGGHYDSVLGCPGANDNATGSAAVLILARKFVGKELDRTLRFVLFVNEEPPYFKTPSMGSYVYASRCKAENENIVGMFSLETIGYYSDAKGSQAYPIPLRFFYPATGNFIGFVGNLSSRGLVMKVVSSFREHSLFPSEAATLPAWIPGVGWSDHWSFWKHGYKAVMVTDTAPFRYPFYHSVYDTPDKIDFDRLTHVVIGLQKVIEDLTILH